MKINHHMEWLKTQSQSSPSCSSIIPYNQYVNMGPPLYLGVVLFQKDLWNKHMWGPSDGHWVIAERPLKVVSWPRFRSHSLLLGLLSSENPLPYALSFMVTMNWTLWNHETKQVLPSTLFLPGILSQCLSQVDLSFFLRFWGTVLAGRGCTAGDSRRQGITLE